jgi:hypothetical protein
MPVMDKMMIHLISNQTRGLISAFLTSEEGSEKVERQRKSPLQYLLYGAIIQRRMLIYT